MANRPLIQLAGSTEILISSTSLVSNRCSQERCLDCFCVFAVKLVVRNGYNYSIVKFDGTFSKKTMDDMHALKFL